MTQPTSRSSPQSGFTLIETMIAIAIMSIGILTLIAAFATAVTATQNSQMNLIARQKALEAMESIYTARDTAQIGFSQVANTTSGGIFTTGPRNCCALGPMVWSTPPTTSTVPPTGLVPLDQNASFYPAPTAFWVPPTMCP